MFFSPSRAVLSAILRDEYLTLDWPAFMRQSCFVTQTNKMTEGGLGRGEKEGTAPVAVTEAFRIFPHTSA